LQALMILFLVKIFSKLGFVVLIEDFVPTIMLDHIGYFRLYRNSVVSSNRILAGTSKILLHTFVGRTNDLACIYLEGSCQTRLSRSQKRGFRIVEPRTFHDRIHGKALLPLISKLCTSMVIIDTNNKSVKEVFHEIRTKTSDYLNPI